MGATQRLSLDKLFTLLFTRWQWVLLLLSAPFFIFIFAGGSLWLIFVPFLWLLTWWITKEPLLKSPLNVPLLLLAVMMLVSLFATFSIAFSLPKIAGVIYGLGLFFAFLYSARYEKSILIILVVFLLTGLAISGLGLLGMKVVEKYPFLSRYLALLPVLIKGLPGAENGFSTNEVAGALLWVIPMFFGIMVLALLQLKRSHYPRRGGLVSILILLIFVNFFVFGVLILTQSRTALIALFISFLVGGAILISRRWRFVYVVTLVIAGALLGYLAIKFNYVDKVYTSTGAAGGSIATLSGRVEIWNRAIFGIQDFPFSGMGMNTFRKVVYVLYPLNTSGMAEDIGHAHDEFLQVALDLGLPGLISFVSIYLVAFWMLLHTWKWAKIPQQFNHTGEITSILASNQGLKALVMGLGIGLLAHAIYGLTDAITLGAKPGVLFWMILGLITGLFLEQRKNKLQDHAS
jgi:putative inorganic carbon (hco3(-)) transporter